MRRPWRPTACPAWSTRRESFSGSRRTHRQPAGAPAANSSRHRNHTNEQSMNFTHVCSLNQPTACRETTGPTMRCFTAYRYESATGTTNAAAAPTTVIRRAAVVESRADARRVIVSLVIVPAAHRRLAAARDDSRRAALQRNLYYALLAHPSVGRAPARASVASWRANAIRRRLRSRLPQTRRRLRHRSTSFSRGGTIYDGTGQPARHRRCSHLPAIASRPSEICGTAG